MCLKYLMAICMYEPTPEEAKVSSSGFAFACATSSATELNGVSAATASTGAIFTHSASGARSRSGS